MKFVRWPVRWPDGTAWDVNGRPRLVRKEGRFFIIGHGSYRELDTRDARDARAELRAELKQWAAEDRRRP